MKTLQALQQVADDMRSMSDQIDALTAERDALRAALQGMLDGYAPQADKNARQHGEDVLVSYVRNARAALNFPTGRAP